MNRDSRVFIATLVVLAGCSAAQEQKTVALANTALSAAQSACAGATQIAATATGIARGGAANTVGAIAGFVTATCNADALIVAVAKDPSTAAWVQGLGTALLAASQAPAQ